MDVWGAGKAKQKEKIKMKKGIIYGFIVGAILGAVVTAVAAGVTKWESSSLDASSSVLYGTPDSGDTIVRLKTNSDGVLQIKGV